jgi:hypothetical protein
MASPHPVAHRSSRLQRALAAAVSAALLVATLGVSTTLAGTPGDCVVRNDGRAYKRLQPAVEAARRGDKLTVRGTCRGSTIVDRSIVIVGVRSRSLGQPILSGNGKTRVLRVEPGVGVTVRSLAIVRGKSVVATGDPSAAAARRLNGKGGGIINRGTLTLVDVEVSRNTAGQSGRGAGGGVYNTGTLILRASTRISRNFAPDGGGVYNTGTLIMKGSSAVSANGSESAGGVYNAGKLTMAGTSAIRTNGAEDAGGVYNAGTLVMKGSSTINGNTGGLRGAGGGVFNAGTGKLTMNDESAIRGNTSVATPGGGVANDGGTVRLTDESSISDNTALSGGGLDTRGKGSVSLLGFSAIVSNTATEAGGGVAIDGGTLTMAAGSSIRSNTAGKPGGGLSRTRGTLKGVSCGPQTYANIYANSPDDCALGTP